MFHHAERMWAAGCRQLRAAILSIAAGGRCAGVGNHCPQCHAAQRSIFKSIPEGFTWLIIIKAEIT